MTMKRFFNLRNALRFDDKDEKGCFCIFQGLI